MPRVVSLRELSDLGENQAELLVYVGRNPRYWGFDKETSAELLSNFYTHNPHLAGRDRRLILCGSREEAINRYQVWLLSAVESRNPGVLADLDKIKSDTLIACHCPSNKPCHAHVVLTVWQRLHGGTA